MDLNALDGGNRRFIMVQLPELCDEDSEAFKAGYVTICEIGKERIRRAGAKILAEQEDKQKQVELGEEPEAALLDVGFRVFKLDSSNLKQWDGSPIRGYGEEAEMELYQRLLDHLEILKPDRTNEDVVFEVMLKLGQDLCETATPLEINGKIVYGIGENVKIIVCLAGEIQPEDAAAMAEHAPGRIIFADSCFSSTEQKSNVRLTLKDKGITIKTL
jgi:adenine-specific DNA-methyltransferase